MTTVPTLYEWVGGTPAIERLMDTFYARVGDDAALAPIFAQMPADHAKHVAAFIAEVLGGPKVYSAELGGHPSMIRHHLGRALTEPLRRRWLDLLLDCADDVGIPQDPEFRSSFLSYLEWGSRLAVINSAPGADVTTESPMPAWGWGEVQGPYVK